MPEETIPEKAALVIEIDESILNRKDCFGSLRVGSIDIAAGRK